MAEFGWLPSWSAEPLAQGQSPPPGDCEESPAPAVLLALLRQEAESCQAWRLLVEERVGERPEMPDRGRYVPLEVVWGRASLAGDQAEHKVRGRRELSRGRIPLGCHSLEDTIVVGWYGRNDRHVGDC